VSCSRPVCLLHGVDLQVLGAALYAHRTAANRNPARLLADTSTRRPLPMQPPRPSSTSSTTAAACSRPSKMHRRTSASTTCPVRAHPRPPPAPSPLISRASASLAHPAPLAAAAAHAEQQREAQAGRWVPGRPMSRATWHGEGFQGEDLPLEPLMLDPTLAQRSPGAAQQLRRLGRQVRAAGPACRTGPPPL
jgi:hypothetical protein